MRFDPQYVSQVLNENFEDAKTLFLAPLMAIHEAHLVMLAERGVGGLVGGGVLTAIVGAIKNATMKSA